MSAQFILKEADNEEKAYLICVCVHACVCLRVGGEMICCPRNDKKGQEGCIAHPLTNCAFILSFYSELQPCAHSLTVFRPVYALYMQSHCYSPKKRKDREQLGSRHYAVQVRRSVTSFEGVHNFYLWTDFLRREKGAWRKVLRHRTITSELDIYSDSLSSCLYVSERESHIPACWGQYVW